MGLDCGEVLLTPPPTPKSLGWGHQRLGCRLGWALPQAGWRTTPPPLSHPHHVKNKGIEPLLGVSLGAKPRHPWAWGGGARHLLQGDQCQGRRSLGLVPGFGVAVRLRTGSRRLWAPTVGSVKQATCYVVGVGLPRVLCGHQESPN